jgi:hypothetical protein
MDFYYQFKTLSWTYFLTVLKLNQKSGRKLFFDRFFDDFTQLNKSLSQGHSFYNFETVTE